MEDDLRFVPTCRSVGRVGDRQQQDSSVEQRLRFVSLLPLAYCDDFFRRTSGGSTAKNSVTALTEQNSARIPDQAEKVDTHGADRRGGATGDCNTLDNPLLIGSERNRATIW